MAPIKWNDLIITDLDNNEGPTLGEMVADNTEALRNATVIDGKISEWSDYFISAPGEEVAWDTPRVPVDWNGFESALAAVRG